MKLDSKPAQSLIKKLKASAVGEILTVSEIEFLKGLGGKAELKVLEADEDKYWLMEIMYGGIAVTEVSAEIHKDELILEVV